MATEDWAIVVGISAYPAFDALQGPENDAKAFYDWLLDSQGGNVPKTQVTRILSSDFRQPFTSASEALPTTAEVHKAIDKLRSIADQNPEGRRVGGRLYLFFSGHGFSPTEHESALMMANADRTDLSSHILGPYTANFFYFQVFFKEIFLFMDCCRDLYKVSVLNQPFGQLGGTAPGEPRKFYGLATKFTRPARERQMADGQVHGVFTTTLLEGLRSAADPRDPEGRITADSLAQYLYENMKKHLDPDELEVPREPQIDWDPKFDRGFIVASRPKTLLQRFQSMLGASPPAARFPVKLQLPPEAVGKEVQLLGSKFEIVQSVAQAPPVWELQIDRGMYLVQVVGTGLRHVVEVSGAGGTFDVQF